MAKLVFILGAGASVSAGAPVMRDFLDCARALLGSGASGESKQAFETVFRYIDYLQRAHSKVAFSLYNLESVFGAFEMLELLGLDKLADIKPVEAMRELICKTLEQTISCPRTNEAPYFRPPKGYAQFVRGLSEYQEKWGQSTSLITFNYDIALEIALVAQGRGIDYGLDAHVHQNRIKVLKLHGSINWYGSKDSELEVLEVKNLLNRERMRSFANHGKDIPLTVLGHRPTHQPDGSVNRVPLIVPPSLSKGAEQAVLQRVWTAAQHELSEAETVVVIGYSLPPTDEFFRYLLALGLLEASPLKQFLVVNPDNKDEIFRAQYRKLLGAGLQERLNFLDNGTFPGCLADLWAKLS